MKASLNKYLAQHSHPLSQQLLLNTTQVYQQAIVVPAFRESIDKLKHFLELIEQRERSLLIWVNNYPNDKQKPQSHQEMLDMLITSYSYKKVGDAAYLFDITGANSLLFLEFAIPPSNGVGEARKIGNDICCHLYKNGCLVSPWVFNTDADCLPETAHLDQIQLHSQHRHSGIAAVLLPFIHQRHPNPQVQNSTQFYQQHLEYYRQGLEWAGSKYAFNTLGSTVVLHIEYYAQVRGFPMRNAAEDFYLLNKLAKSGKIETLDCPDLQIKPRLSDRVPFGTGPSVKKIIEQQESPDHFISYHPACFKHLKDTLDTLKEKPDNQADKVYVECDKSDKILHLLGIETFISHSKKQCRTNQQHLTALNTWFDAFKTRKYIHLMTERYYPKLPTQEINNYLEHCEIPIQRFRT